ncbi:helix-turn-helix domain-containing protein [Rhodococcus hoagii]|nr:helix-turn-helix domain-containing protein [Prescottella equi]NKU75100.1 helix-turn-helix domain-containing protein [Prescottella equi]
MESIDREIGARVEELRLGEGLSQGQLAERLQERGLPWSQRTVSRVESGERPIRFAEAFPLARALGVGADALAPALPNDSSREQLEGWPARFTAGIASQIRRYRERKGWSLQQLADACTELGYSGLDGTLADLESGQPRSIAVHELVVIADALKVPPVELLFPGLMTEQCEFLPGQFTTAWNALKQFTGEDGWHDQASMRDQPGHRLSLMRQVDHNAAQVMTLKARIDKELTDLAALRARAEEHPSQTKELQSYASMHQLRIDNLEHEIADRVRTEQLLKDTLYAAGYEIGDDDG